MYLKYRHKHFLFHLQKRKCHNLMVHSICYPATKRQPAGINWKCIRKLPQPPSTAEPVVLMLANLELLPSILHTQKEKRIHFGCSHTTMEQKQPKQAIYLYQLLQTCEVVTFFTSNTILRNWNMVNGIKRTQHAIYWGFSCYLHLQSI